MIIDSEILCKTYGYTADMDTLRAIECFVRVVEAGSIAEGARQLGISSAAVSQSIARLETHLDVRLLSRTTRRMGLTDSGTVY